MQQMREINTSDYSDVNWYERGYRLAHASYGPGNRVREVWVRDERGSLARKLERYKRRMVKHED